jgi:hypothetical protein
MTSLSKSSMAQKPSMQYPSTYRIRINGHLDTSWSDRLSGMTVSTIGEKDSPETTTLEGRLIDQAALMGVLNTLYDLGFPLVSVEYLECTNLEKE